MAQVFHDEDYNGIVLKIHNGIIATNPELMAKIKYFQQALKDCQFSIMQPDHQRNLRELDSFKDKAITAAARKEEAANPDVQISTYRNTIWPEGISLKYRWCFCFAQYQY